MTDSEQLAALIKFVESEQDRREMGFTTAADSKDKPMMDRAAAQRAQCDRILARAWALEEC